MVKLFMICTTNCLEFIADKTNFFEVNERDTFGAEQLCILCT
ncbi:MAG: hypothetical protein ACLPX5_07170 [Dissulfurispiraceae bacterium]